MKTEAAVFEASAALCSQLVDSTLPEIAFSGRSNVGKSTLINTLLRRKNLARTSATPGKTATINFYRLDTLQLVDMRHPPTQDDRLMMEYMVEREIPFVVVLTKADKLNKTERAARLAGLEQELAAFEGLQTIPYSAVTREGAEELLAILRIVTEED